MEPNNVNSFYQIVEQIIKIVVVIVLFHLVRFEIKFIR